MVGDTLSHVIHRHVKTGYLYTATWPRLMLCDLATAIVREVFQRISFANDCMCMCVRTHVCVCVCVHVCDNF